MKPSKDEEEKSNKEKIKKEQDKIVDLEVEGSFPASDSPQTNGTHI